MGALVNHPPRVTSAGPSKAGATTRAQQDAGVARVRFRRRPLTSFPVDPIDLLFSRLDSWRHLPAYQLERRADVFFALYLPEVLAELVGHPIDPTLIPELPLKHASNNTSKKADYLLLSADRARAYLVELKTDVASRRDSQDAYLDEATRAGSREVVRGICDLVRASDHRRKYLHLVDRLARLGLVEVPHGLADVVFADGSAHRRAASKLLAELRPSAVDLPIEIVFVQPAHDETQLCIDFERFAAHVERRGDPFSRRFAASLRGWVSPAATSAPR